MSNKTIDMFKIRQILRLYSEGRGSKFLGKTTGTARNTVKKYLLQFVDLQLTIELVETMSDGQLAKAFLIVKPKKESSRLIDLEALLPELIARLKKRGEPREWFTPIISGSILMGTSTLPFATIAMLLK